MPTKLSYILIFLISLCFLSCQKEVLSAFSVEGGDFYARYSQISFANLSQNAAEFKWDFGDGNSSMEKNPTHIYQKPGTYTVRLSATYKKKVAITTKTITIILPPKPTSSFTIDGNGFYAQIRSVDFQNLSQYADSYKWDFGNGQTSTLENPSMVFMDSGEYIITLFSYSNLLKDTVISEQSIKITIPPPPIAYFSVNGSNYYAQLSSIHFENQSSFENSYWWTFGDGSSSTIANPSHIYASSGTYTVKLQVASPFGNPSSIEKSITIIPPPNPVASFSFVSTSSNFWPPAEIKFTNSSDYATSYYWNFGDGTYSSLAEPKHTYNNLGDYNVSLKAIRGNLFHTITKTVHIVNPQTINITKLSIKYPSSCLPDNSVDEEGIEPYCILFRDAVDFGFTQILNSTSSSPVNWSLPNNMSSGQNKCTFPTTNLKFEFWDRDVNQTDDLLSTFYVDATWLVENHYPTAFTFKTGSYELSVTCSYE